MIEKSSGQTASEQLLSSLCEGTFLSTWAFPNPFNEQTKEFCDLVAIFENHLFIFFDREKKIEDNFIENVEVVWQRWYRDVIVAQTKTAHGAERYIRKNGKLFLDNKATIPFPIKFDKDKVVIHKIIVANGAKEACRQFSAENVNGSLGITYSGDAVALPPRFPFTITIDRANPVHVLDSHTLPILLKELDTFRDFAWYIEEKEEAIKKLMVLSYCGEEDLLAHYFQNFDTTRNRHFIGVKDKPLDGLMLDQGDWNGFLTTPAYISRREANEQSYFWDEILQDMLKKTLRGETGGNSDVFNGSSALYEMAKEPRVARRMLSKLMIDAIRSFPMNDRAFRKLSYFTSYDPTVGYVLLQVRSPNSPEKQDEFREVRQHMLKVACGVTKNRIPTLKKVIGIAMAPPIISKDRSQDFILLPCEQWTQEESDYYREENEFEGFQYYLKSNLTSGEAHTTEFPDSSNKRS